jgi:acetyl-CoA acyltransferase
MSQAGREVVIVDAVRTPIGRGHPEKGYYKDVHPAELLGRTYVELIARAGISALVVEDVIAGCVQQFGEQGVNIGRNAWLQEGLPIETPAATIDRQCGSAQQAVNFAAALIAAGVHDCVIGSGVEHMGHISFAAGDAVSAQFGSAFTPRFYARHDVRGQGIGAELIADAYEITRAEMDELALLSHQRAAKATAEGLFERETMPYAVNADTYVSDQGIRPDASLEALAGLKPAFKSDGKITAGNSSQISDGAAAVLLMSREKADELGIEPRARILDQTTVGCDPVRMLEGPIPATSRLLERNGMSISDIDLVEVNEAFACQYLAVEKELGLDRSKTNVNGGAIALGHPVGMSGARIVLHLALELKRRGGGTGVAALCGGGGQGDALIVKVPAS